MEGKSEKGERHASATGKRERVGEKRVEGVGRRKDHLCLDKGVTREIRTDEGDERD